MQQIYTVGHSTQSIQAFIELLHRHDIDVVADVRSSPYSARFPHFSKEFAKSSLNQAGIRYVFLGRELGARRAEAECYLDGQANYDRIAKLPAFNEGIDRLLKGAQKFRIALMCAEQDPLTCHRTILVCHQLKNHGVSINHICRSGSIEEHQEAELRLVHEELGSVDQSDMFTRMHDSSEVLEQAYAKRADSIAYRKEKRSDDHQHDRIHAEVR